MRYKEIKREYPSARSACARARRLALPLAGGGGLAFLARFFLLAVAAPWRFVCALARRLGGALAPRPPPSAACARSPRGSGVLRPQAGVRSVSPAVALVVRKNHAKRAFCIIITFLG